ncbi:hypothetical protein [Sphingobacterium sp. Mn56C]
MVIQYGIIALVFIGAIIFMVRKFMPSKNNPGGCSKGCGCSANTIKP